MADLPLGRDTAYPDTYSPELLYPVPRADARGALGIDEPLPFAGSDRWTAWELGWLNADGRPAVAVLEFEVPASSPNLVESKSLKLYLNSLSMTRYASHDHVARTIEADLGRTCAAPVSVRLHTPGEWPAGRVDTLPGHCIDGEAADCREFERNPDLLAARGDEVTESLHSHLLRSLCPVTGQPDTGSVLVRYRGPRIDRAALLAYLVSYRRHSDFHELCVERIFCDIRERCGAESLTVHALYNRRGGIDINPWRSSEDGGAERLRLWRQ